MAEKYEQKYGKKIRYLQRSNGIIQFIGCIIGVIVVLINPVYGICIAILTNIIAFLIVNKRKNKLFTWIRYDIERN